MGILAAFMVPHPPIIVPEVGKGEEKKIADTVRAYQEVGKRIGELEPETIVMISPHQVMYADYFHISPGEGASGDMGRFHAGNVKFRVKYDVQFVEKLCRLADINRLSAGTLGEREKALDHGTMVPLYFVDRYAGEYRLVRIGLSGLSFGKHYGLGQCIRKAAETLGRRTVVIGSGDLSHRLKEDGPYGYRAEGPAYDKRVMEVMGHAAFDGLFGFSGEFCEKAGECGHRSFLILAGALDGTEVKTEALSYEGPFGVGYGICSYLPIGENPQRNFLERYGEEERRRTAAQREMEDAYVRLARRTIEEYVRNGRIAEIPKGLPEEMYRTQAGVFVSIKEDGRLRGCIGTIRAVRASVAEEIVENAVSACSRDPRFSPVGEDELEHLSISVDVLGDMEKIVSMAQLDVKRYGVVVTKGSKRGLLLPNLEGVDTVEEQVAIAKEKAGIGAGEEAGMERFEVVRHY